MKYYWKLVHPTLWMLLMLWLTGCAGVRVTLPDCTFTTMTKPDGVVVPLLSSVPCVGYANGERIAVTAKDLAGEGKPSYQALVYLDEKGFYRSMKVKGW